MGYVTELTGQTTKPEKIACLMVADTHRIELDHREPD